MCRPTVIMRPKERARGRDKEARRGAGRTRRREPVGAEGSAEGEEEGMYISICNGPGWVPFRNMIPCGSC